MSLLYAIDPLRILLRTQHPEVRRYALRYLVLLHGFHALPILTTSNLSKFERSEALEDLSEAHHRFRGDKAEALQHLIRCFQIGEEGEQLRCMELIRKAELVEVLNAADELVEQAKTQQVLRKAVSILLTVDDHKRKLLEAINNSTLENPLEIITAIGNDDLSLLVSLYDSNREKTFWCEGIVALWDDDTDLFLGSIENALDHPIVNHLALLDHPRDVVSDVKNANGKQLALLLMIKTGETSEADAYAKQLLLGAGWKYSDLWTFAFRVVVHLDYDYPLESLLDDLAGSADLWVGNVKTYGTPPFNSKPGFFHTLRDHRKQLRIPPYELLDAILQPRHVSELVERHRDYSTYYSPISQLVRRLADADSVHIVLTLLLESFCDDEKFELCQSVVTGPQYFDKGQSFHDEIDQDVIKKAVEEIESVWILEWFALWATPCDIAWEAWHTYTKKVGYVESPLSEYPLFEAQDAEMSKEKQIEELKNTERFTPIKLYSLYRIGTKELALLLAENFRSLNYWSVLAAVRAAYILVKLGYEEPIALAKTEVQERVKRQHKDWTEDGNGVAFDPTNPEYSEPNLKSVLRVLDGENT